MDTKSTWTPTCAMSILSETICDVATEVVVEIELV